MKNFLKLFCLIYVFSILKTNGQTYLINFAGSGATNTVSTVKVENLTKGTSLTLNGSDTLRLTITTGIHLLENGQASRVKIYPNPMNENSTLNIFPPAEGEAVISICEMTGIKIAEFRTNLDYPSQSFRVSGFERGLYMINVKGNNYQFSGKLICNAKSKGTINLEKILTSVQSIDKYVNKIDSKGIQVTTDMEYSTGDILKFTAISGNYSTVMTAIPDSNTPITFDFETCIDGDGNNYPLVNIGGQLWMAENLKTTKYNDGTNISLITDSVAWAGLTAPAYCWYKNNSSANKETYGGLYNGYSVMTNKLCPIGWHVANDSEWHKLVLYLDASSTLDVIESSTAGGKLREAGTVHWLSPNTGATNETGFNALPGGIRGEDGSFISLTIDGDWWTSSEDSPQSGWGRALYGDNIVYRFSQDIKRGGSIRCTQGEQVLPTLTTTILSSIFQTMAIGGGNISNDGFSDITTRGICWSKSANPTISDDTTLNGTGSGAFSSKMIGLTPGATYYVRAYAKNIIGTAYGNEISFTAKGQVGSVTDIDLNSYQTIMIGTQTWMAENLKTTRYNNGDLIGTTTPDTLDISGESTPKYQWAYNGDENNVAIYGRLYTWWAITDSRSVCPTGWHIPTDAEWSTLTDYLTNNGYGFGGSGPDIAKSMAYTSGWTSYISPGVPGDDQASNNSSSFSARPGGTLSGFFWGIENYAIWWSATPMSPSSSYGRRVDNLVDSPSIYYQMNFNGLSVRCLKDN